VCGDGTIVVIVPTGLCTSWSLIETGTVLSVKSWW